MIIDATDLILGRLATRVAKQALNGEEVHIINSEKAVITGKPKETLASFKVSRERGAPLKGPYYPRMPHMLVKRAIRGMIPYKKPRGREAFERIKCHIGLPTELKDKEIKKMDDINVHNTNSKYITIKEISKYLGAKHE